MAFFVLWIGLLGIFSWFETQWWMYLILLLPGFRIFDIVICQLNILFGPPNWGRVKSYRRNIALLLFNYLEILFCFALFYHFFSSSFHFDGYFSSVNSFWASSYFSLVTMSTLGYGDITPKDALGTSLICIQVLIGIFMGIWIFSRIISFLPKPKTDDPKEKTGFLSDKDKKLIKEIVNLLTRDQKRNQQREHK